MAFAPELLAELRTRTSLADLARRVTKLRKQGQRLLGCCPFHQERTPSFSIDVDKGVFYCFGCKAGGDLFGFVQQLHGLDFKGAVRHLAAEAGLPIAGDSPADRAKVTLRRDLCEALATLQKLFVWQLGQPEGRAARAYLAARRIAPATARAYGVGFGGAAAAQAERLRQGRLTGERLVAAGVRAPEGRTAHLFEGRLTLPVREPAGRILGFGGRLLTAAREGGQPKYLNSRDSDLFHKHRELFGLVEATPLARKRGRVIVCEGYFDVLALAQAGHGESVAALGTQLTAAHADVLARLAPEVVLLFDGDRAGIEAARRAAQPLKQAGLQLSLVPLPPGEDPASLAARDGPAALSSRIEARTAALDYFVKEAFAAAKDNIQAKVAAAALLAPLIADLPQALERELYTARVAKALGVPTERLEVQWANERAARRSKAARRAEARPARQSGAPGAPPATAPGQAASRGRDEEPASAGPRHAAADGLRAPRPSPAERRAADQEVDMLRELLLYPAIYARLGELSEYFITAELATLLTAITARHNEQSEQSWGQQFDQVLTQCVTTSAYQLRLRAVVPFAPEALDDGGVRANRTFSDIHRRLKRRQVDWTLADVLRELGEAESRGQATDELLRRKQHLTARRRALF